ncbi:cell wall metabolism sensor histidine kinase WalK [Granulicella sp. L60]|uniref:sensor histidine kinase n=1 Tax=Granulicella sp. L60 TaxID=1641866 RepID=UPI00131C8A7C|nr:ATP-binding protein [Granulicella sp. L60]
MKPLPIRLRLAVWYFALFATGALLLSLTSWWMLRHTIETTLRQDLQERVDDIRIQLQHLGPHPSGDQAQYAFDAIYRFRDDGKWLQILDQNGHWIYRSPRMVTLNAHLAPPPALPSAGLVDTIHQANRPIRTLSLPISVNGSAYSVETGISINKPLILLHDFGLGLLFLTPAVVISAAAAGHLISRKALVPVSLITSEARRISDRNLDSRLPVSAADDELSQLSTTLNNMLARIDAGFRSVRDFTANASHELRTPLTRLRTEIEVALLRPRAASEYRDSLEHLHQVTLDMSTLIDSLLAIARSDAGTEVLSIAELDLRSLLDVITEEWTPIANRLSIQFQIVDPPSLETPLIILGDRLSLLRLMRIFLDNSFKFTSRGGTVTIAITPGKQHVILAVQDNGPGIAQEHHAAIFNRFFRVRGDTSRQRVGAGLGLNLASWIAEQHNTVITLESSLGQGASFQISLPLVRQSTHTITPRSTIYSSLGG